ncbi:MAG: hypothetical protein M1835_001241 [Candelina submexicana]|nr:MAG: hypothetical protein M1835_001241 [Candelina submexicana]
MQFLNVFLLAFAAVSVNAGCYKSGPKTNKGNIAADVATVCNFLQGGYLSGEERYQCAVDKSGVKWDFALKRVSSGNTVRQILSAECQNGMNKEIGCTYGGDATYSNWYYK